MKPSPPNSPLQLAFPSWLGEEVRGLASLLDPPGGPETTGLLLVKCDGGELQLPDRVYRSALAEHAFAALSIVEQTIAACWFTRHHVGYVRERFLRALPGFDTAWITAYVVTLCGEYVVEILHVVWERHGLFDPVILGRFLQDNPKFYTTLRQRMVSYWNCYHRAACPNFDDYVGSKLFAFFERCRAEQGC